MGCIMPVPYFAYSSTDTLTSYQPVPNEPVDVRNNVMRITRRVSECEGRRLSLLESISGGSEVVNSALQSVDILDLRHVENAIRVRQRSRPGDILWPFPPPAHGKLRERRVSFEQVPHFCSSDSSVTSSNSSFSSTFAAMDMNPRRMTRGILTKIHALIETEEDGGAEGVRSPLLHKKQALANDMEDSPRESEEEGYPTPCENPRLVRRTY